MVGLRHRREEEAERRARPEAQQRDEAPAYDDNRGRAPADGRCARNGRGYGGHDLISVTARSALAPNDERPDARPAELMNETFVGGVLRPGAPIPKRILFISAFAGRMAAARAG